MKTSVGLIIKAFLMFITMTGGSLWAQNSIVTGPWGGEHIQLLASEMNAIIELDCAHGEMDGPIIPIDQQGRFSVEGTFTREHGGPVILGEEPDIHPALYTGIIQGDLMELMITLTDSGQEIGIFELVRGQEARLFKCL